MHYGAPVLRMSGAILCSSIWWYGDNYDVMHIGEENDMKLNCAIINERILAISAICQYQMLP